MKRITFHWLLAGVLMALLVSFGAAQSDSLGDYARQVRKQKGQKPAGKKEFDDDTMPKSDTISVVGQPRAQAPAEDADKSKDKASEADAQCNDEGKDQAKPEGQCKGDSSPKPEAQASKDKEKKDEASEREKLNQEWQKRLEEQKGQIDLISRELDVMQREYRLRAAAMYADAGNRMRNATQWDKEDSDYKQKIAAKEKALDDAKQKLEDLKEEARKAGIPAVYRD